MDGSGDQILSGTGLTEGEDRSRSAPSLSAPSRSRSSARRLSPATSAGVLRSLCMALHLHFFSARAKAFHNRASKVLATVISEAEG